MGEANIRRLLDAGSVAGKNIKADTIAESTSGNGVAIDGMTIKDSVPYCDTIAEKTSGAGVTIDGIKCKDSVVYTDTISEKTSATGVTIDGVLNKDGAVNSKLALIDAGASTTLTAAQSGSLVVLNSSDVVNLPAVAAGLYFDFLALTVATQAPRINPGDNDGIYLDTGTYAKQTDGYYIAAGAIGDCIRLYCDGTDWFSMNKTGTWTVEGA